MTEIEQKIIKKISDLSGDYKCYDNRINHEESLVLDRLLTEIQQYKAIGTVEEIEKSMQNVSVLLAEHELLKLYQSIGTVEEFKDLKEKNVAKKIVSRGQGHEADCYCPNCNAFLGNDQDWCFNQTNHCSECGQALEI